MSERASYFKLGLFVIVATFLLLTGVALLGADQLFQQTIGAETYFEESVEGLDVGAAVKHRGVRVGKVSAIQFASDEYHINSDDPRSKLLLSTIVVVTLSLDLRGRDRDEALENIEKSVKEGLRTQLVQAGLTGGKYIELTFVDPTTAPPLDVPWTPRLPYIPSVKSFLGELMTAAERIAKQLEDANIGHVIGHLDDLLVTLDQRAKQLDIPRIQDQAVDLLEELRASNRRLQAILENPAIDRILADVENVANALSDAIGGGKEDLATFVHDLPQISERLKAAAAEVESLLSDQRTQTILTDLARASESAPPAVEDFRRIARRVEVLLASQQSDLEAIITALRRTLENAEAITGEVKGDPARLLFGAPPKHIDPGQGAPPRRGGD